MSNKDLYKIFCEKEPIPVFSQYWWLDAVCGENNWDVILVEKGGEIWASMPFFKKKKLFFSLLSMPPLTQKLGPYIRYPKNQGYYKKLSWEKEIMNELISKLPKFDKFYQKWDYKYQNWLPFYWKGFKQTTLYTYVIKKGKSIDDIYNNFHSSVKRRLKKAEKLNLKVIESDDYKSFYDINKRTFERKNQRIQHSLDLVEKIFFAAKKHNSLKLYFAVDQYDEIYAAGFFVYDKDSVYYLLGGINPEKKDSGAMNLVIYEGIKFAIENNLNFDFEGSMVEPIEKYFRSFGAVQKRYFLIFATNNKLLKIFTKL
ncbi:FemAB family protein [Marinitoga sp. 1137]|uniref:GNAT family N-acetyltransferase n=1 Tax=Marinitoga sp. 1137 TaxID=1545835 RepID=UPI00095065AA|nr:GNAT family N-acetyltransferase [Marinitoga sp. 1137]APT76105.1 FemAB family protein [Marinitoga sp. 1137]